MFEKFEESDRYEYMESDNELIIRYALGNERFAKRRKSKPKSIKKLIWFCIIWTLVAIVLIAFCLFNQISERLTAIIMLVGILGLYIPIQIFFTDADLSYKKYYTLKVNKKGISEIWDEPEEKFQKTVLWSELKYYGEVSCLVSGWKNRYYVDFIIFSSEEVNKKEFRKMITEAWDLSGTCDFKLKDIEHTIFLGPDGFAKGFVDICKLIDNYLIRNKIELPDTASGDF